MNISDSFDFKFEDVYPYEINLEFDRRFSVWHRIIHRNRLFDLSKYEYGSKEVKDRAVRYINLDLKDASRLYRRASKEFLRIADDVNSSNHLLILHKNLLKQRGLQLEFELTLILNLYDKVSGLELVHKFTNGWIELNGGR